MAPPLPPCAPVQADVEGRASIAWEGFRSRLREAKERAGEIEESIAIAGCRIRLVFAGPAMRDALFPALEHLRIAPHGPVDATLHVWDSWSAGVPNPLPWLPSDVGPRGEVAVATDDRISTAIFGAHCALSVFDRGTATGMFWMRSVHELPWYERAAPFRTLIHWMLLERGVRFVHAAAIGTAAGGALLAGRGGSGKTTTALRCLIDGMDYAGDDYVAVRTDTPVAHSIFGTAKLGADTLALLPEIAGSMAVLPTAGDKGVLLVGAFAPERLRPSLPLRTILLPRVVDRRETIARRVSAGQVLLALAPTTIFQLPGNDGRVLADLSALVRQLPSYVLELGRDLSQVSAVVRDAIEGNLA